MGYDGEVSSEETEIKSLKYFHAIHPNTESIIRNEDGKLFNNKSDRVQTSDAFWRSASVLVPELSFKWHSFMFLKLFCSKLAHFSEIQLVRDGRTDRRTDRRTDIPSYRDARTHLKKPL